MNVPFEGELKAIAALDEPVRRDLYRYVVEQARAVGRAEAAEALGITRILAAFHLDKLVQEGLLEVEYRRLTGRTGPGAGRPSKLYRRAERQFDISLPPRQYELAARLFAQALDDGLPLDTVATNFGARLGVEAGELERSGGADSAMHGAALTLAQQGFEPFWDEEGTLRLRNCPFHALMLEHTSLVCGMNLAIMRGMVSGLQVNGVTAVLDPRPGACCVAFYSDEESKACVPSRAP
jgi:predicted ArsR family transcriptional regulator